MTKKTIYRSALLVWVYEQGFVILSEVGELKEEPARPPLGLRYGRLHVGSLYRVWVIYATVD